MLLPPLSTRVQSAFSRADAGALRLNSGEALVETRIGTGDVYCPLKTAVRLHHWILNSEDHATAGYVIAHSH